MIMSKSDRTRLEDLLGEYNASGVLIELADIMEELAKDNAGQSHLADGWWDNQRIVQEASEQVSDID